MTRSYVVTGAASGIGKATMKALKREGKFVIGIDLRDTDITADLGTAEGRAHAAKKAIKRAEGRIDAVICCAGLASPTTETVAVNFFGMTDFLEALAPTLADAKKPRAVLVSSMASLQDCDHELVEHMLAGDESAALTRAAHLVEAGGGQERLIYGSTKRAISRWVRREAPKEQWAGARIPLNAVGPGIVDTPMVADMIATQEGRDMLAQIVPMPLNGYLEAAQVAQLLVWLASPENSHICGQTIYIDGGSDVVLRGDNVWDLAH